MTKKMKKMFMLKMMQRMNHQIQKKKIKMKRMNLTIYFTKDWGAIF